MPSSEEIYETRNKVKEWFISYLEKSHPKHSAATIAEKTAYAEMLEKYKEAHPNVWTGPYSSY